MPPLVTFHALRLPDSFPDALEEFSVLREQHEALRQRAGLPVRQPSLLSELVRPSVRAVLSDRLGVAELAVLSLPFVQRGYPDTLVDLRRSARKRRWPCPQILTLIQDLARALVQYDEGLRELASLGGLAPEKDREALALLERRARVYIYRFRKRTLQFKYARPRRLTAGLGEFIKMLDVWEAEIYDTVLADAQALSREVLLTTLYDAFLARVCPDACYTKEFMYASMASILKAFGVEAETEQQIAWRIKASLQQRPKDGDKSIETRYGNFF